MRTQSLTVGSQTFSPWIPIDSTKAAIAVGVGVLLSSGASLTYGVQHTHDDVFARLTPGAITRSGTAVTVNLPSHGLSVNDFIHVEGANTVSTDVFDGNFAVATVVDANNITYTVGNSGATTGMPGAKVSIARVRPNSSIGTGQTASADTNYAFPPRAIRLNVSLYTSGNATITVNQGTRT